MKGVLSCKKLAQLVRCSVEAIKTPSIKTRPLEPADCLMSACAVFSLKYRSLLQFDHDSREKIISHNLSSVYGIKDIPSDTRMTERLDEVSVASLRKAYKRLFSQCQRSKHLELLRYCDNRYLLPLDASGYFYSKEVHGENCCEKNHRDGSKSHHHQMLSGALVHPDRKVVLAFAPEPIMKSDGARKNDCEHRLAERLLADLEREHPHLPLIITGDGLCCDGPFIKRLKQGGHRFILVAKESNHKALFEEFPSLPQSSYQQIMNHVEHEFNWINGLSLNDSHLDCSVNALEHWELLPNGKQQHWVWVRDLTLNERNVDTIMRGGRARHKIENETFNTLKNQGYQFEHNFGHGNKNLSSVFAYLMMLAFLLINYSSLAVKRFKKHWCRCCRKSDCGEISAAYLRSVLSAVWRICGALWPMAIKGLLWCQIPLNGQTLH